MEQHRVHGETEAVVKRDAEFCSRQSYADQNPQACLFAALFHGDDASAVEVACEEAELAGVNSVILAAARRRARMLRETQTLEVVIRSTKLLMEAVNADNAVWIERACQNAEVAGVSAVAIEAARQRLRELRETSLLAAAIHSTDPVEIDHECDAAAACGANEGMVVAARERARQLREVNLFSAVLRSADVEEIDVLCAEASASGISDGAVTAVRWRVRQLREERMLSEALQGRSAVAIERACDDAEAAGVCAVTVGAARQRARHLQELALVDAMHTGDVELLEVASAEAESLGVEASVLTAARLRARQLRAHVRLLAGIHAVSDERNLDVHSDAGHIDGHMVPPRVMAEARERARHSCLPAVSRTNDLSEMASGISTASLFCTICLDPISVQKDDDCCMLPCLHIFHCSCVENWINSQGTCPNCRLRADIPVSI